MDKSKEKEKSKYADKLDGDAKIRYLEKVRLLNGFDPYEGRENEWSVTQVNLLPPLSYYDMVNYLVFGRSAYTLDQFKNYKTLDSHVQFTNGWVHELKTFVPDNCDNTVIKAKVLHSQRLNEKALLPWVVIDKEGCVVCAHCNCMAGLAETCTHVGALLFKVEAVVRIRERATVTGAAAYWMIPAGMNKVQPEVCHKIDYTSAATKKKQLDKAINSGRGANLQQIRTGYSTTAVPAPSQQEIAVFLRSLHQTGDKAAVLSVVPDYCHEYKDPVKPVIMPASLRKLRNLHFDNVNLPELLAISDKVTLSEEEALKVERETREQHNTPAWFAARAGRITASQLHAVCIFKMEKPAMSTITNVCYPGQRKVSGPAVHWGLQNEARARENYEKAGKKDHFGFHVKKAGFIINPAIPHMGASPDGIVFCECCGRGCVEIKGQYKYRELSVKDALPYDDFCLVEQDGTVVLSKNHAYYYQVQCQLMVSEADFCDFVVWTPVDFVVWTPVDYVTVRIEPDEQFVANCQQKAKVFFDNVVLPEMIARYYTKSHNKPTTGSSSSEQPPAIHSQKRPLNPAHTVTNSGQAALAAPRKKKRTVWCHCPRSEDYDDMIACDNENCKIQWFHASCVGLSQLPGNDDSWFCSTCLAL